MKKIISLVLCALMVFCWLPMTAFAAETYFSGSNQILSGETFTVREGDKWIVDSDMTLYVPASATLKVEKNAELVVDGSIIIMDGGTIIVEKDGHLTVNGVIRISNGGSLDVIGDIRNGQKVKLDGSYASAYVTITYSKMEDFGAKDNIAAVKCQYGETIDADLKTKLNDIGGLTGSMLDLENGGSFKFPLNKVLFVDVDIIEPVPDRPRFDESLFKVFFKGAGLGYAQGYHSCIVSNSGDLSFSQWTNDADFYKMCRIQLPSGEGYEVVGRDWEANADGAVYLKYGEPFSFRVEIEEAYDMSDYQVYIYNGYGFLNIDTTTGTSDSRQFKATPTGDGWYTFSMLDSETGEIVNRVIGDSTVQVIGVVKNETINMIGSILEAIKSVFNMLKEFFEGIIEAFKGGI